MSDSQDEKSVDLERYAQTKKPPGPSASDMIAIALGLVWIVLVIIYLLWGNRTNDPRGVIDGVMTFLAVFLPLALIWIAATTMRTTRELRAEAMRLQGTVDAIRKAYSMQLQRGGAQGIPPQVERKLDELVAAQRKTGDAIAMFTSRRDSQFTEPSADRRATFVRPNAQPTTDEEPKLALGTPAEALAPPLPVGDFIRALNFPENAEDKDGFRALRAALDDRNVAKLIRAAQDVLTLLAQDGIYMDDLKPDRARPELWRKFAAGERGRAIAGLGGIRDRSSLAIAAGRMRSDPVFRDAVHHFLRNFDQGFAEFEKTASDAEIVELAESRTARAFMLFGRVTGTFN